MKKIISLVIALLLVASLLVSCSSDVPEGMKSVTVAGEPFILYVPEGFSDNTASGVSSAFYKSVENDIIVVARHYTPAEDMTIDAYMQFLADSYAASLEGFEKTSSVEGDILSGIDARRLEYKMTDGEVTYIVAERVVKYNGAFVSLVVYTTGEGMSVYAEFIESILESFTLCEKQVEEYTPVTDKKTPEGMQIASDDVVEYRLYVPLSWICDAESGVSEAYYPESEKTNVTLTSYSPDAEERGMSLSDYVDKCIEQYKKDVNGFSETVSVTDGLFVADKEAKSIEFSAEYGGVTYKLRQVIFYASEFDLYYTFTYTATEERYEQHMADFDAMVEAFCFR